MQDFYVYIHRKATTGEVFYVGKGQGDRAYSYRNRNDWWLNIAMKHGVHVDVVLDGLQEWYALELEKDLICLHGRCDIGTGTLVNMTDGGEGISGLIHSEESKKKMSVSKLGNTHMVGVTRSDASKKKMSEAKRKTMRQIRRGDGVVYESTHAAARDSGVRQGSIVNCVKGRCKTAGGHSWSYV
jgi:hypothetical protein